MKGASTRIALAGFGAWGQMHSKAVAAIDSAEIVAVFCHGEASTQAAAELLPQARRFRDYAAMLAAGGFDVVNVAVPNHRHASFAIAALEAGADVFLEKPLGLTLGECDAVTEVARRTGRLVTLNHELRVSTQWGGLRAHVQAGHLGRIRYQHFSLFRRPFRQGSGGWRYDNAQVGSWILEELVHYFDLVLWYATENGNPVAVRAFGNGPVEGRSSNFTAVVEWADGSFAVLSQCLSGFEHHITMEVTGTNGAIRTWWSGALDRTLHPDFAMSVQRGENPPEKVVIPFSGEVFELEENMRQALAGFREGRAILPPEQARKAIELCLAAEEAHRTGERVEIRI